MVIQFGFGTVLIGNNYNELTFRVVKSSTKIGDMPDEKDIEVVQSIKFGFDEDMIKLKCDLDSLENGKKTIKFRE